MTGTNKVTITCESFKPIARGTLRGFAVVVIPEWRLRLLDVAVHVHESGAKWAALPAKPQIDRTGQAIKRDGKIQYSPVIELIDSRDMREAFSHRVIEAVLALDPHALDTVERTEGALS
jgi:hypothetical protein